MAKNERGRTMTPDKHTIEETMLDVGNGHTLYIQTWGNKHGAPMLFLHGGPGSGCSDKQKKFFDPNKHYVVFFDQRGSGKSLPTGSLTNNTTAEMVADIDKVLAHAGIKKATFVGGSWGSLLALYYALQKPEKVDALVVRGVFTGRKSEIDFINAGGFKDFFPEVWDDFVASVPTGNQENPAEFHASKIFGMDAEASKKSAYAFGVMEGSIMSLDDRTSETVYETYDPASSMIEMHYILNGCFIEEGYILKNAHRLHMPVHIVQGRYDLVCPPITAYELAKLAPQAELQMTVAGHSGWDRENYLAVKTILGKLFEASSK